MSIEQIERIKDKLALLQSLDAPKNWRDSRYFLHAPLSKNKINEIESQLGITFTDDMRLFFQFVDDRGWIGDLHVHSIVLGYEHSGSPPRLPILFAFPLRMKEPDTHFGPVHWDDLSEVEKKR